MTTNRSKSNRMFWLGLLVVLICSSIFVSSAMGTDVSNIQERTGEVSIDPQIYVELEKEGGAQVLVILKEQADLSLTSELETKIDKGTFVYQRLTEIAEQTQGPLREFLESQGADFRSYWIQNMFMVKVDTRLLIEISRQPGIDRIELYHQPYIDVLGTNIGPQNKQFGPNPPVESGVPSSLELFESQYIVGPDPAGVQMTPEWGISRVNADDVWNMLGITGEGAVVGDLDTGVQWDHPALINAYRGNLGGGVYDHNYNWWDGLTGSQVPIDYDNHGTHTMGTIVGDEGGVNQIGMAPGAKWIACPGLGDNIGPFDCFQFFLAPTKLDGSEPRPDLAPHVISNSWSSAGTDYHTAIQALYAAGIFYSKSAGNTGPACSTITNPGQWSEVTAAAAFAQGDTIASFSSRGPVIHGHDYYIKPDIAAPGVNVRSSIPGDSYASMQGTSMACPHVTGAVALLISANPDLAGRIDILQMLLKQAAVPKISAQCTPFVDHPNDVWGWGILDAYDAVIAAQNVGIGSLEGSIFDTTTTDPIPDAHITFMDTVRNWKFTGFSNEVGNYLKDLPASTYDLTASHYGYLDTTISDVDVIEEMTVYQDIALTPAPVWEVSGEVVDSLSGGPLAASVKFEGTPINVFTDPATGNYSANVAQGVWWMDVKSPGHTGASREITVTQNLVEDFVLTPIENYYMHMSLDGMCGPAFNWIDATSGGDPHPLGDDANVYVGFTNGETFTFYGNTYTGLFIGSNGIVTFGSGSSAASGPIPNPTAPNNGIYGFSMDLNPASGSQGNIYTKYLDNRYFVIEWYQVQHYPSGNPETFEIILDFDTNQATIQYLTVSDPSSAVSGVENLTGTEATQYAYGEPTLIADGNAVTFYPHFGTPPPIGGTGELSGVVTDASSGQPIEGAFVLVESFSTGTVFTMTTDIVGAYTAPLCADWYDTTAEAAGYIPSEVTTITVMSGTLTTQDFTLEPCVECSNLDFSWTPTAPLLGQVITFTATASGTLPISFTWDFGDGAVGSGEVISHAFTNAGTYTVSVSANNCAGIPVTKEYLIEVQTPYRYIFLPLTIK